MKANSALCVRHAQRHDIDDLLRLMLKLAEFEGYAQQFKVNKQALEKQLFERQDFSVLVAEVDQKLVGILVFYYLPFTYDLTPWAYIKELYVETEQRSLGIGKQLMQALAKECHSQQVTKIRWDVLSSNTKAMKFYQSLGGAHDKNWMLYSLNKNAINSLAQ